jgi:hypothetical protein
MSPTPKNRMQNCRIRKTTANKRKCKKREPPLVLFDLTFRFMSTL